MRRQPSRRPTGRSARQGIGAGFEGDTYDVVGRVSGETRRFGSKAYATTYTYDQAGTGKLIFLTLPGGQLLNYSYDPLGRVSGIGIGTSYNGPFTPIVSNLSYFPFGALREIDFANGVVRYENNDLEYKLDGLFLTKGSTTLVQRYHAFGDHLNLLELNNDAVDTTKTQHLGYDDAQRLTSASASGTYGARSWTYDKVGNRLGETRTPAESSTRTTSTFTYPATSNLLASVIQGSTTTRAFTYDAAGNTTQDRRGSTAYTYAINDAGRISRLTIGTTVTANYTYDAKDRLSVRQTLNMSPAGTTQMLYDVWDHLLAETDGAGHVVKQYVWVGDEPVAVLDGTANAASPVLYYVHADHLQRPELMTNAAGSVVWRAYYEPFGAVSSITGALTQNQRFPGRWFEIEAGLAYNWHRHYDPSLGRYTSADPTGLRGGSSLFGYARQHPLVMTDYSGFVSNDFIDFLFSRSPKACPIHPNMNSSPVGSNDGPPAPASGSPAAPASGNPDPNPNNTQGDPGDPGPGGAPLPPPTKGPDFVTTPGGVTYPVPSGVEGPTPVINPQGAQTGITYQGGSGGNGPDPRTTGVRIMDPVTTGKYQQPGGYGTYNNASGQGINPLTGKTIPNSDPMQHIPGQ